MTTEEKNRLIAEFMGAELINSCWHIPGRDMAIHETRYPQCLLYHSSWDWLMPVFDKIQTIENGRFKFDIDPWLIRLVDYKEFVTKDVFELVCDSEGSLIYRFYYAVVTFIEWYNKHY